MTDFIFSLGQQSIIALEISNDNSEHSPSPTGSREEKTENKGNWLLFLD